MEESRTIEYRTIISNAHVEADSGLPCAMKTWTLRVFDDDDRQLFESTSPDQDMAVADAVDCRFVIQRNETLTGEGVSVRYVSGPDRDAISLIMLQTPFFMPTWSIVTQNAENPAVGLKGRTRSCSRLFRDISGSGDNWLGNPTTINQMWISGLEDTAMQIDQLNVSEHRDVIAAIDLYVDAFEVSDRHELHILGIFAALERLLVSDGDSWGSITGQLRRSIPLLLRREGWLGDLEQKLAERYILRDGSAPANPIDKHIRALYEARSKIAHGGDPMDEIERREVRQDVVEITRRLLRQAVAEPNLVMDLKGPRR